MTINENTWDEKAHYDTNKEAAKNQQYHQVKLINMNILQVKEYYCLIKKEW